MLTLNPASILLLCTLHIGAYATWFHAQETTDQLMQVMNYVVNAFSEPALSLHAARALRDLCENNRQALSTQIQSFAALYANLHSIPVSCNDVNPQTNDQIVHFAAFVQDSEKTKVLQAICSVVQALPPKEAVAHVSVRSFRTSSSCCLDAEHTKSIQGIITPLVNGLESTTALAPVVGGPVV